MAGRSGCIARLLYIPLACPHVSVDVDVVVQVVPVVVVEIVSFRNRACVVCEDYLGRERQFLERIKGYYYHD